MSIDLTFLRHRIPGVMGESGVYHSAVAVTLLEDTCGGKLRKPAPEDRDLSLPAPDRSAADPARFSLLFEVRSEKIGHQPGDVCCPGGMLEEGETPEHAALREMTEELLVQPRQIEILGPLDIFSGGSMLVHPFVCILHDYDGRYSADEVSEVFRVPLSFFLENEPDVYEVGWRMEPGDDFPFDRIHGGRSYPWRKRTDRILFYEYEGHVIWGMTAKIIEEFVRECGGR